MNHRLIAVAKKETIHILRDRRLTLWAFALPVVLLLLFGYAITLDIKKIPTAVMDLNPSSLSREIISSIEESGYFNIRAKLRSNDILDNLFLNDKIKIAIVFPNEFRKNVSRLTKAPVQIIVDGSDNNTALIAAGYLQKIFLAINQSIISKVAIRSGGKTFEMPIKVESRVFYNPELRSKNFLIPGLMATILGIMSIILTALCIAREYDRGTIEQLIITPVNTFEFFVGKLIPYFCIGFVQICTVLIVSRFLFGVPINGSLISIMFVSSLFLCAGLGQGLLISIGTKSQQLAMMFALLSGLLPSFLLSGFIFPVDSMPEIIRWISLLIPARHLLDLLRGLMVKGCPLYYLWWKVGFLFLVTALFLGLSMRSFKKNLG